jgi:uncharacterized membrane protein YphA (DoxX/SURF4 family)
LALLRKSLLAPIRLAVGWGLYPRLLGWIGISMLILLRVTIGWHFYTEGIDKYSAGDWDAKPFFANARGPVAERYRQLVWDWDGSIRLDEEKTMLHLAQFRDRVGNYYGFDDAQKRAAKVNYAKSIDQFKYVLASNAADIQEYELGRERIKKLQNDFRRDGVESLAGQTAAIRAEWTQKVAPSLKQIDEIWKTYELSQNNLATPEQSKSRPPLKMGVPRTQLMDTSVINRIVPYFDIAIGVCLILGLFTPVAALAAAGFLGSVFVSQYPPTTGPSSSMYQLIEGVACLVLAGTGAGRFGGLDFFFHTIICKFWPSVEENK